MAYDLNDLIRQMKKKQLKLAIAESISCGKATSALSEIKDISEVLIGSVISYSPEAKKQILGVSDETMCTYTCESSEVTCEMVKGLRKLVDADVYAAVTGLAAPGGSETPEKPVGTVFYCFLIHGKTVEARYLFQGDPDEIMEQTCSTMYRLIGDLIQNI